MSAEIVYLLVRSRLEKNVVTQQQQNVILKKYLKEAITFFWKIIFVKNIFLYFCQMWISNRTSKRKIICKCH